MISETVGRATLYLGDFREVAPLLACCDHVITDPPFEAEAHNNRRRTSAGRRGSARCTPLPFAAIDEHMRDEAAAHMRCLSSGWALAFCQAEAVAAWRGSLERAGAAWRRACIWVKPDGTPQFTGDRPGMGYESIATAWCRPGPSRWNGGGRHGVFTHPKHDPGYGHGGRTALHPTTKPQALMRDLVAAFTSPGETILDLFMGSGSTGVAAVALGRRFVGIEVNPAYFDLACQRIDDAQRQTELFAPAAAASTPHPSLFEGASP